MTKRLVKKPAIKNEFLDESNPSVFSGGNIVLNQLTMKLKNDISKSFANASDVNNQVKNVVEKILGEKMQPLILLQYAGDYFTNSIPYKISDIKYAGMIQQIIRNAWLNGRSGLYIDTNLNKTYAVNIVNVKVNLYNEIEEISYSSIHNALNFRNVTQIENETIYKIKGVENCKKIHIFNWGVNAFSAWITIWPFIQKQSIILQMIDKQAFVYNKKFTYTVNNAEAIKDDMELFINPDTMFLFQNGLTGGDRLNNLIEVTDFKGNTDTKGLTDYYREFVRVYYDIFGRRLNDDFKKERNTDDEVQASQEQYGFIALNWIREFKLFCNSISSDINSPFIIEVDNNRVSVYEDEQEQEDTANESNRMKEPEQHSTNN